MHSQLFYGFDTETTGVDPTQARLVTASIIIFDGDETTKHSWLADPGVEISDGAAQVHGITTDQARAHGRDIVDVLSEVADLLMSAFERGAPVVAYNANYDLTLMEFELARHGLPTLTERLGRELSPVLDPYMLDRAFDRWRKGSRKLVDLAYHYGVAQDDSFHDAEADVLVTMRVLAAQRARFGFDEMPFNSLMRTQKAAYANLQDYFDNRARAGGKPVQKHRGWPVMRERSTDLYASFIAHCQRTGCSPLTPSKFGSALTARGYPESIESGQRIRRGVSLPH